MSTNNYVLKNAVIPQLFTLHEDGLLYFDRLNPIEGRFCRYKSGINEVLFEITNGQGIIDSKGNLFSIEIGEYTKITSYSYGGDIIHEFSVEGIILDFTLDENGNYISIGLAEGKAVLYINNPKGELLQKIVLSRIIFASAVSVEEDRLYVTGFDKENTYMLMEMNYIGRVSNEWHFKVEGKDRVISKIIKTDREAYFLVSGSLNSVIHYDMISDSYYEITPRSIGCNDIQDINISDGSIYVLDGNELKTLDLSEKESHENEKSSVKQNKNSKGEYIYFFLVFCNDVLKNFKVGMIITTVFTVLCMIEGAVNLHSPGSLALTPLYHIARGAFLVYIAIAGLISVKRFLSKDYRIGAYLKVYNYEYSMKEIGLLIALMVFWVVSFLTVRNIRDMLLIFIDVSISTLLLVRIFRLRIKGVLESGTIDLFHKFMQKDYEYVRQVIDYMLSIKCDSLEMVVDSDNANRLKAYEWMESRRRIISSTSLKTYGEDAFSISFDFAKRNIRYARLSILLDFIYYMGLSEDVGTKVRFMVYSNKINKS